MPRIEQHEIGNKVTRRIFFVSFVTAFLGYIYDLYAFWSNSSLVILIDVLSIGVFFICLIYYFARRKNFDLLYTIGGYVIVFSIYMRYFIENWNNDVFSAFLLRDTLYICLVLTMLSIAVGRIHSIIVGIIAEVATISFSLYKGTQFMQENVITYCIAIGGFVILVYYFMWFLEALLNDLKEKGRLIQEQNTELSEINASLIASQHRLQDQSQQLTNKNTLLEEHNRQKDIFLSIVAHDLRNPVSAIYGLSNVLVSKYQNHTDERRILLLQNVAQISHQTGNLLDNLLEWGKNQSNSIRVIPKELRVMEHISSVVSLIELPAKQKDILLSIHVDDEARFYADKQMFETIVRNILSNAIKFSHQGGEIRIEYHKQSDTALLTINDEGVGMDQQLIDSVLAESKSNLKTSIGTNGEKGTGLGLIICREFIRKNNGTFRIESEIGRGTCFYIELPRNNTFAFSLHENAVG